MSGDLSYRTRYPEAGTAPTIGWLSGAGPRCLFCHQPAPWWKPIGWTSRLWWCPPCETTWVSG